MEDTPARRLNPFLASARVLYDTGIALPEFAGRLGKLVHAELMFIAALLLFWTVLWMHLWARAIRRGLRAGSDPPLVVRTGYGTARAASRAGELKATSFGQLVVMGVGGGLTADLAPGDLVVGTEVGVATCPGPGP